MMETRQTMNQALEELGGCWPTPSQELLLKAALMRGNDALGAWQEWMSRVDIERLDTGSYRMLPLLYHRLNELGTDDPEMKRLKGVYRYTWCKNQVLFHNMSDLLRAFSAAGIETMVLKGTALVLLHYRDLGLRPMDDFDILVPTKKAVEAINLLRESGWVPVKEDRPETILPKRHSTPFRSASQLSVDLHWHLFEERVSGTSDDDFWADAVPAKVNDVSTCALNPTDQLLHTFVHGIRWNSAPPFRWIADGMAILNTSESQIDWKRLLAKAQEHRVVLPVRDGLDYMQKTLGISVPPDVIQALRNASVSKGEVVLYDVQTRPYNKYGMNRLLFIWVQYKRYLKTEVGFRAQDKLLSFPKFIKRFWNVESYWKIPFYALFKPLRRILRIGKWHQDRLKINLNKNDT